MNVDLAEPRLRKHRSFATHQSTLFARHLGKRSYGWAVVDLVRDEDGQAAQVYKRVRQLYVVFVSGYRRVKVKDKTIKFDTFA